MKKIIALTLIGCMLISLTGCGEHTTPTSTVPSGVMPAASDDTSATQIDGTTKATSQGNSNSGTADYVSSDSRITPVSIADYWISDTQFDFINYCKDQGATVKYMLENEDGSIYYCSPEELASTGKTPLAIGGFFNFGGDPEFVSVYCMFGNISDTYYVNSETARLEQCIGTSYSGGTDVRVTIDDYGNTLSLSTINHMPVIFEYMMVLPYGATAQDIHDTFNAHYHDYE